MFDENARELAIELLEEYTDAADALEAAGMQRYVTYYSEALETLQQADGTAWNEAERLLIELDPPAENFRDRVVDFADLIWFAAVTQWIDALEGGHKAAVDWIYAEDDLDRANVLDDLADNGGYKIKRIDDNTIQFHFEYTVFVADASEDTIKIN